MHVPLLNLLKYMFLLKVEYSKEKMNDEKLCPLCCRYCTSGLPSDITVVVGEQSFHLHKVNFHQNHSQTYSFFPTIFHFFTPFVQLTHFFEFGSVTVSSVIKKWPVGEAYQRENR
jgi:hypothetical protein